MSRRFDVTLFLSGVLTGSKATQQRHLRQAQIMQAAIHQRWHRDNPWTWQLKHVRWFLSEHLKDRSDATRYYYRLTALLIWRRLGKPGCEYENSISPSLGQLATRGEDKANRGG